MKRLRAWLGVFCFVWYPGVVWSADLPAASGPIQIKSHSLEVMPDDGTVRFSGAVQAVQGSFKLFADTLIAYYADTEERQTVERLEADGNIRFEDGTRSGSAGHATYAVAVSSLVLTENPVVRDGRNVLKGKRITYAARTGRIQVENARTRFYQEAITGIAQP